jgi:hypothetical protein
MMEAIVPVKHRFLQEPHVITSQKTTFFIVSAVKTLHENLNVINCFKMINEYETANGMEVVGVVAMDLEKTGPSAALSTNRSHMT